MIEQVKRGVTHVFSQNSCRFLADFCSYFEADFEALFEALL